MVDGYFSCIKSISSQSILIASTGRAAVSLSSLEKSSHFVAAGGY